jgi:predicted PurR-regulated permease PerM
MVEDLPDREPKPTAAAPLPLDVTRMSLVVLAVAATVAMLYWGKQVFIPLLLGLLFSHALSPLVERAHRWRVHRALAAAFLIVSLLGAFAFTAAALRDDAEELVESLPETAQKLGRALQRGKREGTIDKVQKAASELEQAAERAGPAPPPPSRGVTRVQVEKPKLDVREYLWIGTMGAVTLVGQAVMVCFITFFMLASGDSFRRKLMHLAGPTFSRRRITVQLLDEIADQIQRYLLVQVSTSLLVGVATWLVFLWIGLDHAGVWGALSGVLNLVPYIGAIAVTAGAGLVGFVQFGSLEMGLTVAGASFVIQSLEGYLVTPWLTSRASRMSPLVIFVTVLAFGWMWGMWGLLLGVPILMMVKAVCDHVDDLKPVGELLGD